MHSIIFHYPHILRQDQPLPGHDRRKTGCSYHRSAVQKKFAPFSFQSCGRKPRIGKPGAGGQARDLRFRQACLPQKSSKQAFSVTSSTQDIRPSSQLIFFIRAFAPDVACCIFQARQGHLQKAPDKAGLMQAQRSVQETQGSMLLVIRGHIRDFAIAHHHAQGLPVHVGWHARHFSRSGISVPFVLIK